MFVLMAQNADNQAQIFGLPSGNPFKTEDAAELKARQLRKAYPFLDFQVMPISPCLPKVNPLSRHALATADPK